MAMQDVCRFLLFNSGLQQGNSLEAQRAALSLGVAACAEATKDPPNRGIWEGLIAEHSKLLAKANLSQQAADARCCTLVLPAIMHTRCQAVC